jgi:adenosylcobinamide-phosphate synthase
LPGDLAILPTLMHAPYYLLALPQFADVRLAILVMALALDAVIGDAPFVFTYIPHPVVLIGQAIALFERRLNVNTRTYAARRTRGIVILVALGLGSALLGAGISYGLGFWRYGWAVELLLVAVLVAQRGLYRHVSAVKRALAREGLEAGRAAVSRIVGRDPEQLDQHGVVRAAIESLAENFSDGVVAPVLFYLVAGLPGILLYKTVNTLDSMIGHRNARFLAFGWASARCDDLFNLVPARLAGLLIALAAMFVPRGKPWQALRTMVRDARKHRSPNAGWPEAAMAGALGLSLSGPRRYGEVVVTDPWLGDGRARATLADLDRSLLVFVIACLLLVAVLGLLALALTA